MASFAISYTLKVLHIGEDILDDSTGVLYMIGEGKRADGLADASREATESGGVH